MYLCFYRYVFFNNSFMFSVQRLLNFTVHLIQRFFFIIIYATSQNFYITPNTPTLFVQTLVDQNLERSAHFFMRITGDFLNSFQILATVHLSRRLYLPDTYSFQLQPQLNGQLQRKKIDEKIISRFCQMSDLVIEQ